MKASLETFVKLNVKVWLRDSLPAREVFEASEAARLDGVDAGFALQGPCTGTMGYVHVRATGRKWRFEPTLGSWRLTVRVRFVGEDYSTVWTVGEIIAETPAARVESLRALGLLTESLREIS